jgi:hypothetical protein
MAGLAADLNDGQNIFVIGGTHGRSRAGSQHRQKEEKKREQ